MSKRVTIFCGGKFAGITAGKSERISFHLETVFQGWKEFTVSSSVYYGGNKGMVRKNHIHGHPSYGFTATIAANITPEELRDIAEFIDLLNGEIE